MPTHTDSYETGEMPSVANGRLILAIKHPKDFLKQLKASRTFFSDKEFDDIKTKVEELYEESKRIFPKDYLKNIIKSKNNTPNEYNGFRLIQFDKIALIISRYSQNMELFKTKLNKLLFYTDFLCFKRTGYSMTGLIYDAFTLWTGS